MTTIFSSKKELSAVKTENETLKASVTELTNKVEQAKDISQELATLKEQFNTEKTELNAMIETMKSEFNGVIESLKQQLSTITSQKTEVEQKVSNIEETAKAEVEKEKGEIKEKIMEAVAVKVASMGITENELPKVPQNELAEKIRIVRYNAV